MEFSPARERDGEGDAQEGEDFPVLHQQPVTNAEEARMVTDPISALVMPRTPGLPGGALPLRLGPSACPANCSERRAVFAGQVASRDSMFQRVSGEDFSATA
jgi:hypothetical protein